MYNFVLPLHSLLRWLVLVSLLVLIIRSYSGWLRRKTYTTADHKLRSITVSIAHVQFIIGVWLYMISPITNWFVHHFSEGTRVPEIRFFGMEHVTMMLIAITVLTLGSSKAKHKVTATGKFRTQAIWCTIALLLILSSIPWAFSPLVHRPWLRAF